LLGSLEAAVCDPKIRKVPASHCFCLPNARINSKRRQLFGSFVMVPDVYSPSPRQHPWQAQIPTKRKRSVPDAGPKHLFDVCYLNCCSLSAACGIPGAEAFITAANRFPSENSPSWLSMARGRPIVCQLICRQTFDLCACLVTGTKD